MGKGVFTLSELGKYDISEWTWQMLNVQALNLNVLTDGFILFQWKHTHASFTPFVQPLCWAKETHCLLPLVNLEGHYTPAGT